MLAIEIKCGEKTCAKEPGKFCEMFGTVRFGQIPICRLFPSEDAAYTKLKEKDGWVLRCEQCIKAEVEK